MTLLSAVEAAGSTADADADATVLVTDLGEPCAGTVCRALRDAPGDVRLVGTAADANAHGFEFVDVGTTTVAPDHDDFVPALVDVVHDESADAVLPLGTDARRAVAHAKPIFQDLEVTPVVADLDVVETAGDTRRLYDTLAQTLPLLVPDFTQADDVDELLGGARALGYPDRRVAVTWDSQRPDARRFVLDPDGAGVDAVLGHDGQPTVVTLSAVQTLVRNADESPSLQLTEALPGERREVDVVVHDGDVVAAVPQVLAEPDGSGAQRRAERDDPLVETATEAASVLGLEHNFVVQFGTTADGTRRLTGVVPGLDDAAALSVGAGVNTPALGVACALGHECSPTEPDWGTAVTRSYRGVAFGPNRQLETV
jgi:hypothetical protein